MSAFDKSERVAGWLAAASQAIRKTRYCWLATSGNAGAVDARPMGRTPASPGDDDWLIRFVTDARSRKIEAIGANAEVGIVLQREAEDCYLSLRGLAVVRTRACEDGRLWRDAYAAYFPGEGEQAHAAFIEVRVDRMELWMRGVTPEPFGLRPVRLEREGGRNWREVD
jgi:general stress protein 26